MVNHRNYGTWAYDGAIYDQAIWFVSRGEQTFMTVRGMDVWGHHLNLVFFLFAPFYWLGAGPEFLYVVQNFVIALAALPIYLVAKERFQRPSIGLLFAVALPDVRADPVDLVDQLPPRGAVHRAVHVRLVVRHEASGGGGSSSACSAS